ncbi:MAG: dethiobiotin synthase [Flavobacteriia bacterium]|nr:dethiobiotin synthase [Flavobacteriia bacterium]
MKYKQFFITGIGTEVGKTIVSAVFCKALESYYWKPIQAGDLDQSDSIKVKNLVKTVNIIPEIVRLQTPASPHFSAEKEGIFITEKDFNLPKIKGALIIEGAGGLMVPINKEGFLFIDLIIKWKLPVILVVKHYLGSINHSLLSIEVLKSKNITPKLIVFTGEKNLSSEQIIHRLHPNIPSYSIPFCSQIDNYFIENEGEKLKQFLI